MLPALAFLSAVSAVDTTWDEDAAVYPQMGLALSSLISGLTVTNQIGCITAWNAAVALDTGSLSFTDICDAADAAAIKAKLTFTADASTNSNCVSATTITKESYKTLVASYFADAKTAGTICADDSSSFALAASLTASVAALAIRLL